MIKQLRSAVKWLYPGMRVKRWMLLTFLGVMLVIVGAALATNLMGLTYIQNLDDLTKLIITKTRFPPPSPFQFVVMGLVIGAIGFTFVLISIVQFNRSVLAVVAPDARDNLADRIFVRRSLAQGQRIVVLGGGTGLSTMLRGLKEYTSNIVAVVTVTDNGGSSGRLTQQMGILPPGDLRNCLVALADAEPTLSRLFQYRFEDNHEGLAGHSFGNLFIAAMTTIYKGNYEDAIAATAKVLAIRGKVYPSTTQNVALLGELEDGTIVEGETEIVHQPLPIKRMYIRPESAQPLPEVLRAIKEADAIILGPGSVYTSVVPNLLVDGIADAISRSKAVKVYVCNVMTQPGETQGFTASDHIKAIAEHAPGKKIVTHVLVNKERPAPELLEKYEKHGQKFVEPDLDAIRALGYTPVPGNFISQEDVVRHDSARLAEAIFRIVL
ncbi:MAG: gluconeogenesis factor YvcK family protein [Capsulimonas sp.]|uniref:gluconeogenesis factor YvcK family protein n=1 Tax=Capsulimonas sp. TaxID=2494211 RepID=UPI003263D70F